jgi:hypothetical protein
MPEICAGRFLGHTWNSASGADFREFLQKTLRHSRFGVVVTIVNISGKTANDAGFRKN